MNLDSISGYRTYITCLISLVLLICNWQGWLKLPGEIYSGLMFVALWFLRSAIGSTAPPMPAATAAPAPSRSSAAALMPLLLLSAICLALVVGCVATAPGASPFVVNVERLQTVAPGAFDLVTTVDDSNRAYWRTNAPRFHAFVEKLRMPVPVNGTNYPACVAGLLQLEDAKVAYKAGRGDSNTLWLVFTEVSLLYNDATTWSSVVTKPQP